MKQILSAVLFINIIFFSCQRTNDPSPPPDNQPAVGVYVVGMEQAQPNGAIYIAKYWKDGVPVSLSGSNHADANAIVVSGGNVYVAGSEWNGTTYIAKYWKNGVPVSLTGGTHATGIAVSGSDVYVSGGEGIVAKYWKNGTPISLITNGGSNVVIANCIVVSGSDVYVAGQDPFHRATLWKNGDTSYLSDRFGDEMAISIAVSGSDVYVTGIRYSPNSEVKYWKNGVPVILTGGRYAHGIAVSGSDVYVTGGMDGILTGARAGYWKNGTFISLTDGSRPAYASGIAVSGSDVYVVGHEGEVAKYWKNGTPVNLTDGSRLAYANDIVVIK